MHICTHKHIHHICLKIISIRYKYLKLYNHVQSISIKNNYCLQKIIITDFLKLIACNKKKNYFSTKITNQPFQVWKEKKRKTKKHKAITSE